MITRTLNVAELALQAETPIEALAADNFHRFCHHE
jgi:hypothetical protein